MCLGHASVMIYCSWSLQPQTCVLSTLQLAQEQLALIWELVSFPKGLKDGCRAVVIPSVGCRGQGKEVPSEDLLPRLFAGESG